MFDFFQQTLELCTTKIGLNLLFSALLSLTQTHTVTPRKHGCGVRWWRRSCQINSPFCENLCWAFPLNTHICIKIIICDLIRWQVFMVTDAWILPIFDVQETLLFSLKNLKCGLLFHTSHFTRHHHFALHSFALLICYE